MPAALLKEPETLTATHDHRGQRVANAQLPAIAAELNRILLEDNAFQKWEADAIVDIVMNSLKSNEPLGQEEWRTKLHSRGFTKEFAKALASKLSR